MTQPIITSFVYPPIPVRTHDWCAYRDPEHGATYGYGRTEAEAVEDFLAGEAEREADAALDAAIDAEAEEAAREAAAILDLIDEAEPARWSLRAAARRIADSGDDYPG